MAPGVPDWNPQEKAASLLHLAAAINETARLTLMRDGTHVHLAFLVGDDGELGMVPPTVGDPADLHEALKKLVAAMKPYGVIQIAEAWTYVRRSTTDHTFKQVVLGELRVSDLSQGERTEALTVRVESKEGAGRLWISPILRGGGAKVSLGEAGLVEEPVGGRLGSIFYRWRPNLDKRAKPLLTRGIITP